MIQMEEKMKAIKIDKSHLNKIDKSHFASFEICLLLDKYGISNSTYKHQYMRDTGKLLVTLVYGKCLKSAIPAYKISDLGRFGLDINIECESYVDFNNLIIKQINQKFKKKK